MATYRLEALALLARQLSFTPLDVRAGQIDAAERLLHDLDPDKAYPIDFVIYRVTGYQPKSSANAELLTGLALQHDLGLLIEQVSDELILVAQQMPEPVLSIDEVTQRFNVTSKTVQRWRRRGLPARRFIFPDGKRRVGFLLSSVERFFATHREHSEALCTAVADDEQQSIVHHAHRLAYRGCCVQELSVRIGKKFHRTPAAVLHTLRKHDAELPGNCILNHAAHPLAASECEHVVHLRGQGHRLAAIATQIHRPRSTVYRALLADRVARLSRRKVRFIDDPLYHDTDADQMIADIISQHELVNPPSVGETRVPRDLPPYLRDLYRTPLLSPARERALFLKFNFHKSQFATARRKLDPQFAKARELDQLEQHLHQATQTKNQILQANLRLVVSVARRHVRPSVSLMELVSEGNVILMRAVEGFDIHKGYRFSTYATLALMKGFAHAVPQLQAAHRGQSDSDLLSFLPDTHRDSITDRDQVQHLLSRLDNREQQVLRARFGLGVESVTCEQVATRLGVTQQRVRQIEQNALAKLRG